MGMRILPTRWHGLLDYLVAILLIALPEIVRLPAGFPRYVPVALGIITVLYSLITSYEWGLMRMIPMRAHLVLDLLNGLLLAVSPWLFGFATEVWKPHLVIGCTELLVVLISKRTTPAVTTTRAA